MFFSSKPCFTGDLILSFNVLLINHTIHTDIWLSEAGIQITGQIFGSYTLPDTRYPAGYHDIRGSGFQTSGFSVAGF